MATSCQSTTHINDLIMIVWIKIKNLFQAAMKILMVHYSTMLGQSAVVFLALLTMLKKNLTVLFARSDREVNEAASNKLLHCINFCTEAANYMEKFMH